MQVLQVPFLQELRIRISSSSAHSMRLLLLSATKLKVVRRVISSTLNMVGAPAGLGLYVHKSSFKKQVKKQVKKEV